MDHMMGKIMRRQQMKSARCSNTDHLIEERDPGEVSPVCNKYSKMISKQIIVPEERITYNDDGDVE
jgi:hypothetical protein